MVSEEVQILSFKSIILNMPEKLKEATYTKPKETIKITSRQTETINKQSAR